VTVIAVVGILLLAVVGIMMAVDDLIS